jgi:UDP-glucose:(glucosyl)LPS alpha-1,3-glucosyltransferase/UDP-glucose:(galactosyl)LPS alpha-1,2-glucosyltransferase
MISILYNTNSFIDFYILETNISQENKDKIRRSLDKFNNSTIEYLPVDSDKYFKGFDGKAWGLAAYNRLVFPLLKPNIKKAIYLDVDTLVLGDIKEMWNLDMEDIIIRGSDDRPKSALRTEIKGAKITNKNHIYFNSGVLLINYDKWREVEGSNENILKILTEIDEKIRKTNIAPDQGLLNHYFSNKGYYEHLPLKFNDMLDVTYKEKMKYFDTYNPTDKQKTMNSENDKPIVRHFTIGPKAWNRPNRIWANHWWFYAKMGEFWEEIILPFQ